jgi:hypothetical protein
MRELNCLDQIKQGKYKYPNQVYEVPVESDFLYHLVMASLVINPYCSLVEAKEQQENPNRYVETMESSNEEK